MQETYISLEKQPAGNSQLEGPHCPSDLKQPHEKKPHLSRAKEAISDLTLDIALAFIFIGTFAIPAYIFGYNSGQNNTAYTTTCQEAFKQTKEEITKLKSDYDNIKSSMEKLSDIKQCLATIDELAKLRKTPPSQQPINKK
jgi:hypothetical protein